MNSQPPIRVVHMISGDLWAGAEAQAFALMAQLAHTDDIHLFAIVLNEGRLASQLRSLGVPVAVVDENRYGPLRILTRVRKVLAEQACEVLHTHRYKENVIGAFASRTAGRPRLVKTVHGLVEHFTGFERVKSGFTAWLDRAVTRAMFDRVICVSDEMKGHLGRVYRPEQLVCIRNGIDAAQCRASRPRSEVRADLGIAHDAPVVGTASRLVGVKGLGYLLEAASSMRASLPGLRLLIAGDGPDRKALQAQAHGLDLEGCVVFAGHRDDVFDLIAAMDVFVLPSLSEGIPMVLLEAMALGTPVVATAVGGVPEIIRHGESGLLVPSHDSAALAGTCLDILESTRGKALANRAMESVRLEHSAARMGQQVAELYRQLWTKRPGAAAGPRGA